MNETNPKIRVAILENHQGIVDGYVFRLGSSGDIKIVATATYGEDLEPLLARQPVDVLILDVHVPTSPENSNTYPILHQIPKLLQSYPQLVILVISMHAERKLIRAVLEAGANGYILKDDQATIRELATVIRSVATGGIYLSQLAHEKIMRRSPDRDDNLLTLRQLEALSLCAAYPDAKTSDLASRLGIANSTIRNLLSEAYLRLGVRTRSAAIAKARQLELLPSDIPTAEL